MARRRLHLHMHTDDIGQYVEHFAVALVDTDLVIVALADNHRVQLTFDADEQAAILAVLAP